VPAQVVDPSGEFTALAPTRILDTRSGLGEPGGPAPLGPGSTIDVEVGNHGGVPAIGVQAVVLNVTAVTPTAPELPDGVAHLRAGPPEVSSLNLAPGQTVANAVTVPLGGLGRGLGRVSIFNAARATHVIVDVAGYYADSAGPAGSRFVSTPPSRIYDTRMGSVAVCPGCVATIDVTRRSGIPSTGVTAVVLNFTVTAPTQDGWLTIFPAFTLTGPPDRSTPTSPATRPTSRR
jgi:hypothetical protein